MTTDTGLAAIKLPADLERRGALEEYFAAVALSARRRELVAAAQASISEADAEVARTHERCVELGLLPAARRTTTKKTGDTTPRAAAGSVAQSVIDAVADGASTPAEVAARIGCSNVRAAQALLSLTKAGRVHREKDENDFWRYSPIGGEA